MLEINQHKAYPRDHAQMDPKDICHAREQDRKLEMQLDMQETNRHKAKQKPLRMNVNDK